MNRKPKTPSIVYGPEWTPDGTRDRYRWVENASRGLRIAGDAHSILPRLRHTGWHLDPLGTGETVCGSVLMLPGKDRMPRYVPAIRDPYNADCYTVDFHNIHDDASEAARDADGMAERYAELERDFNIRESAKLRAEDLRDEASELRARHRAAIADMRAVRDVANDAPNACALLRDALRGMRQRIRDALKEAARLESDPYSIMQE